MLHHTKGFINLCFLHKLNWMKTEWDQARFSSLVKRFELECNFKVQWYSAVVLVKTSAHF